MNKRIQKKQAKRLEHEAEIVAAEAAIAGEHPVKRALELVRNTAAKVEKSLRSGKPREAVRAVQEGASEAISQVKAQVNSKLAETEQQIKDKIEHTEQEAEALLKKVPVVGVRAAKKLHDVTHR